MKLINRKLTSKQLIRVLSNMGKDNQVYRFKLHNYYTGDNEIVESNLKHIKNLIDNGHYEVIDYKKAYVIE